MADEPAKTDGGSDTGGPLNPTFPSLRERRRRFRATLFGSAEGHLFIAGLALSLLYSAGLAAASFWSPVTAQALVGLTAMQIVFGRAAGLSVGYAAGLDHRLILAVVVLMETVMVLLVYPLFVFSWRQLFVIRALRRPMSRIHAAAERHRRAIRRYGIVGLAFFVWFPCFGTGPVIGCILGFLLGMRWWVNIGVVLAGTYLAIISWAFLLRNLLDRLSQYTAYAPLIFVGLIILVITGGRVASAGRRRGVGAEGANEKGPDA